jgi:hypothetical protein
MTPEQTADALETLGAWLDHIGGLYGLLASSPEVMETLASIGDRPGGYIRPCWYRHWDVVFELSWLYQEWRAAYESPSASIRAVRTGTTGT